MRFSSSLTPVNSFAESPLPKNSKLPATHKSPPSAAAPIRRSPMAACTYAPKIGFFASNCRKARREASCLACGTGAERPVNSQARAPPLEAEEALATNWALLERPMTCYQHGALDSRRTIEDVTAIKPGRLDLALARATAALLEGRTAQGSWTGELSSSALSTATAVTALAVFTGATKCAHKFDAEIIAKGLEWLADHANEDGGWGDTTRSVSNLSTTVLCWAAFGAVPGAEERFASIV